MPRHPLTNLEIQKHYQNEPKFKVVYSTSNLPKIKDGAYLINFEEIKSMGTHWIALYMNAENVTYFENFGVEHIPKTNQKFRKFIVNGNIERNIYRIQAYDSRICGYFFVGYIDFMLKGKSLSEYTNLFSPNESKKNEKIVLTYFQQNLNKLKCIVMFAINTENLKKLEYHIFLKKHQVLPLFLFKCGHEYEKMFKKNPTEILTVPGLITNTKEYQKIYNHV